MRIVDRLWRKALKEPDVPREAILEYGGFRMSCDLNEMLQRQFYFFGTYFLERKILGCWTDNARGAHTIFDLGANAGIFSLAAAAVAPNAAIHAFEPTPEIAKNLRETAAMNKLTGLHVHELAISDSTGVAALVRYRGSDDQNAGMNFISRRVDERSETVRTVSLDDFCESHAIEAIDLLKIDIQGNEHLAITGARKLLREGRVKMIFTELNWAPPGQRDCPASELTSVLDADGYWFAEPAASPTWRRAGDWMRSLLDVVASR